MTSVKNNTDLINAVDTLTNGLLDFASDNSLPWVCADCGITFCEGMPDECIYGDPRCTAILERDKTTWKTQ